MSEDQQPHFSTVSLVSFVISSLEEPILSILGHHDHYATTQLPNFAQESSCSIPVVR